MNWDQIKGNWEAASDGISPGTLAENRRPGLSALGLLRGWLAGHASDAGQNMKYDPMKEVERLGQSVCLDYIRRCPIVSGKLGRLIEKDGLRGMTSNPAIFERIGVSVAGHW